MAQELAVELTQMEPGAADPLEILVSRLERGERVIERYRADGRDVHKLEDHWIELLKEYEALFDAQRRRAA